ncbi:GNAT family N-acetyltransferase [Sulfuritalea sp.]|uniref:GNAT family N-acetyltransferase n=1 Tax=Sulfuritalea sp. TaxID=2480090 RepID=UPI00286DF836|nr:GNAT family N-acetyltransferase [Sulfuritalea sp.]
MSARQPWAADFLEVEVRPAGASDRNQVAGFLAAMDRAGLYQRHFSHGEAPNLALLRRLDAVDWRDRVAVLAVGFNGQVLGHGEYVAADGRAEFALMVLPQYRAHGIGGRLLQALLGIAVAAGQQEMHGIIQAGNTQALKLTLKHGFGIVSGDDPTTVIVSRSLKPALPADPAGSDHSDVSYPLPPIRHDLDRTSLHRRPGPGAPLRARG